MVGRRHVYFAFEDMHFRNRRLLVVELRPATRLLLFFPYFLKPHSCGLIPHVHSKLRTQIGHGSAGCMDLESLGGFGHMRGQSARREPAGCSVNDCQFRRAFYDHPGLAVERDLGRATLK